MSETHDQSYLLKSQYKDGSNFNARVELHRRFSTNPSGWHHWIFDHFQLGIESNVLELGCGPGWLWQSNRERIPESWQITLTDFSPGMLDEARQRLGEGRFAYQVADAQGLPFADASFDAVIANHMLYHMPDLSRALAEIRRVLKPGGRLYASTLGRAHLCELDDLMLQAQLYPHWQHFKQNAIFVLENGREELAPFFAQMQLHLYENTLEVTEAEPLVAYACSSRSGQKLSNDKRAALTALVEQELAVHGTLHMSTASGLFEARKI